MGAGPSLDTGVTHICDVTKVDKEFLVFDWTILDFDCSNLTLHAKSSTFQAGERLGRPSQWYLALNNAPERCGYINVGLYLESATSVLDMPKDITARVSMTLLDGEGKLFRELGHATKTFEVPVFGGPQPYLDCYEWKHAIDLDVLKKEKNMILMSSSSALAGSENTPHLHLRLKMEIQGKFVSSMAFRGPMWMSKNVDAQEDYSHSRGLWSNKENSNCIIKCQNLSINAHMQILTSRSRIFDAMLKSEVKTSQIDKDNANRVILPVDNLEPEVLENMLRFMYVGNLEEIPWNLEMCLGLMEAADQFELHSLKTACFIKMLIGMTISNAGDIAVLAHNQCAPNEIKCQISDFIRLHWNQLENMDGFYNLVRQQPLAFAFFHLPEQIPFPGPADPESEQVGSITENVNNESPSPL